MKLSPQGWNRYGLGHVIGTTSQVDWHWASTPDTCDFPNHKSCTKVSTAIGLQLDACYDMGMIEYKPSDMKLEDFANQILPIGARIKPNGKIRMLVDPSLPGVNQAMAQLPLKLTSAEEIFKGLKPNSFLAKRDLDNGFYHVTLTPQARKAMGFRHPVTGQVARWVVLPQGTRQSPAIFCNITNHVADLFNKQLQEAKNPTKVNVFVDDFIYDCEGTHAQLQEAYSITDATSKELGLSWNLNKDIGFDQPIQELEVLGLVMNTITMTMKLSNERRVTYLSEVKEAVQRGDTYGKLPRKMVERLVGKLVFASRVNRWGFLFLQNIMDAMYPPFTKQPALVDFSKETREDMESWIMFLSKPELWPGIKQYMVITRTVKITKEDFNITLFSDASKNFGVGGIMGDEVFSERWSQDRHEEHIGTLELEALQRNLVHWAEDLSGQRVLAYLDNTQAIQAVNKGFSRVPGTRKILLEMATLGMERAFEVRAAYVKGCDNPADAPSRGKQSTSAQDYTFIHFDDFNNPPARVDACAAASGYNVQPGCHEWYSLANPVQNNIEKLVGKSIWANVPFTQAGPVLDALVEAWKRDKERTTVTAVVPEWKTSTWYLRYIRCRKPLFTLLHRYPAGTKLFKFRNHTRLAPPCPFPILVLRLGYATT